MTTDRRPGETFAEYRSRRRRELGLPPEPPKIEDAKPVTDAERTAMRLKLGLPTATPTPEPDYRATVEALTAYWPTEEGFKAIVFRIQSSRLLQEAALRDYGQYAAVYVARECLNSRKRSVEGFRSFVTETLFRRTPEDRPVLTAAAGEATGTMVEIAEQRINLGLSPVRDECWRMFMYPETGSEAIITANLVAAVTPIAPIFAADVAEINAADALSWFDPDIGAGTPLLLWLCSTRGRSC